MEDPSCDSYKWVVPSGTSIVGEMSVVPATYTRLIATWSVMEMSWLRLLVCCITLITFPYTPKNTAFDGPTANKGKSIPLKKPRILSYLKVLRTATNMVVPRVCCLTFIVSRGWPTMTPHIPKIVLAHSNSLTKMYNFQ